MKPDYVSKNGKIKLYNMDCMDYLAQCSENEFDLAVVDPPYRDENQPTKDMRANGSMASLAGRPNPKYWNAIRSVAREQIAWGANNFQLPQWKGFLVWKKQTISESFTMSMCEIASLSEGLGTVSKWIEMRPQDSNRIHPTQKPVKLYQWILDNYAKPEQRILDTHLGSGSSAIAAHYFGCEFVGIELDKDYFEASVKRFEQETAQIDMFSGAA